MILAAAAPARASIQSIVPELLSESVPSAFSPNELESSDFSVEWVGAPIPGVEASITHGTLQWVRISNVLVLPRGRLVLTADKIRSGHVAHGGNVQPFEVRDGRGRTDASVALISDPNNTVDLTLDGNRRGKLRVRFKPRPTHAGTAVFLDNSCSPFRLQIAGESFPVSRWAYVGCRLIHLRGVQHNTATLALYVHWDNAGTSIMANGVETISAAPATWIFNVRSKGTLELRSADGGKLDIGYGLPERDHRAFFGAGIGPYAYQIHDALGEFNATGVVALPTLYAGYRVSETARIVAFDATALHRHYYSDFGLYLSTRSVQAVDNRLTVNVMLGAHVLAFGNKEKTHVRPTAPQGIELVFSDFLMRRTNLTLGGFVYPKIDNQAYNNLWIRWGNASFFAELNYISWRERIGADRDNPVYSRSAGLTFGIPLFSFL